MNWPTRIALAAALAAPILALPGTADAVNPKPRQCGTSVVTVSGRVWVPERRPVVKPCVLRPIVRVPSVWGGVR
jgi:hypothetical protein